jgi:hypothetical protein
LPYVIYDKRDSKLIGWSSIYVYHHDQTDEPCRVVGGKPGEVQCATMDRTPFPMNRKRLDQFYQRRK